MFSSSSMFIEQLLAEFDIHCQLELNDCVRHLVNDSRNVGQHDIFCAVQGTVKNGGLYIQQAIDNGCDLVLVECLQANEHGQLTTIEGTNRQSLQVAFYQLNAKLFALAQAFYRRPERDLTVIGVTGTNGKTTTSQLIAQLLNDRQHKCAVIGTNGAGQINDLTPLTNTTPGATELYQLLADFNGQAVTAVAMEVSSHALAQNRVKAELFDIAIFTNLSRDHLDYHQTMTKYAQAKYQLFTGDDQQIAIVNGDDQQAKQWLAEWPTQQTVLVYGRTAGIQQYQRFAQARAISYHHHGVTFTLVTEQGQVDIDSPLLGDFNIDNLLAAIAVLLCKKMDLKQIANRVKLLVPIAGRMERYTGEGRATAIVDYAHTPDALQKALIACRQHCRGSLWLVFGCGGDRDRGKRPKMGAIAEQYSDQVIVTNDNPRAEDPTAISNDILSGCKSPERVKVILNRQQAVIDTLNKARANDLVLLAGKGHEDHIIHGNKRLAYSERKLVKSQYAHFENEASK